MESVDRSVSTASVQSTPESNVKATSRSPILDPSTPSAQPCIEPISKHELPSTDLNIETRLFCALRSALNRTCPEYAIHDAFYAVMVLNELVPAMSFGLMESVPDGVNSERNKSVTDVLKEFECLPLKTVELEIDGSLELYNSKLVTEDNVRRGVDAHYLQGQYNMLDLYGRVCKSHTRKDASGYVYPAVKLEAQFILVVSGTRYGPAFIELCSDGSPDVVVALRARRKSMEVILKRIIPTATVELVLSWTNNPRHTYPAPTVAPTDHVACLIQGPTGP